MIIADNAGSASEEERRRGKAIKGGGVIIADSAGSTSEGEVQRQSDGRMGSDYSREGRRRRGRRTSLGESEIKGGGRDSTLRQKHQEQRTDAQR